MLAQSKDKPFNDPSWIYEVKWDGIRAIAYINESLTLRSRNDKELLDRFPELQELANLTGNVVLDGEIIVMRDGQIDFQTVAQRTQASDPKQIEFLQAKNPATYIVFDILEKNNESLIDIPLSNRREILEDSLKEGRYVILSSIVEEQGVNYYQVVQERGMEGIIAKRKESLYHPGSRSSDWLKIKTVKTCDCAVFGFTPGTGNRKNTFGALLLGLYDQGKPVYVGRVGTGFTDMKLQEILDQLNPISIEDPWFDEPDIPQDSTWVNPKLVAIVGYQQVTNDNRLRAPRFQGLRSDKPPFLCSVTQIKPQKLEEYYAKRDFSQSPEPVGGLTQTGGNSFVVQEHHARRLHYDFRLERDDVLASWAIPKGVPLSEGERRLAIQTEDHPLEYGGFEGTIPDGLYGAGEVSIWDKGFYVPVRWLEDKIEIVLVGERLKGRYELVRFEKAGKNEWLIFKKQSKFN
jgi:DNA ligase D-like protein (predicted ligase)/DNA ligase D-like protein (predicted 3'-phosphoesterase)